MLETLCDDIIHTNEPNMPNTDNSILPSSVVVCADENLSCDLQGEAVVLSLQSGTYFGLNPLGARIWELIQKPARVSFVLEELLKEYAVDAIQCEADLLSFLKLLQTHELITVQDAGDD
jgi:hypothetical protein